MEIEELEVVQLELKYCERCGGLWLRVRGSGEVYCAGCAEQEGDRPDGGRKMTHTPPINSGFGLKSERGEGQAWLLPSAEGGNA